MVPQPELLEVRRPRHLLGAEPGRNFAGPLVLLYPAPLPSDAANSVQTVAMAEAFGKTQRTVLVAYAGAKGAYSFAQHYGVRPSFEVLWLEGFEQRRWPLLHAMSQVRKTLGRSWVCFTRIPLGCILSGVLRAPTALEVHAIPSSRLQRILLRVACRLPTTKVVVAISGRLSRALVEMVGCPERKLLVAHDAAPQVSALPEKAALRSELGFPMDARIVGYVGTLKPDKGVDVLLEALSGRDDVLVLVAGGVPAELFRDLRSRFRAENVRFLGQISPIQAHKVLGACDISVAPYIRRPNLTPSGSGKPGRSEYIHEFMSPLKIFEALAVGIPLVVSDLPVLHEVLRPGRDCMMFPPGDVESLRRSVDALLADPDLRERLSRSGVESVSKSTWMARAERINQLLRGEVG